ncbi:hypothetical protein ACP70R_040853 [Stipagrostis hirtigluma subsp. patula]
MATSGAAVVSIDADNSGGKPAALVPYVLSFTDLSYSLRERDGLRCLPARPSKTLLDGISGEARVGELLAFMGASGSGKSTLVDALAGRIARGASAAASRSTASRSSDDLLHPTLTVRETLLFAAELRLPRTLPAGKKRASVDALIDKLGLSLPADTVIGGEGRRAVSGGERRRVSIGMEIIHDPILLLLDEPTSRLDSASACCDFK